MPPEGLTGLTHYAVDYEQQGYLHEEHLYEERIRYQFN